MEFKTGQIISFRYRNGLMWLEAIGNRIHYGDWGFTHSAVVYEDQGENVLLVEADGKKNSKNSYTKEWLEEMYNSGKISIETSNTKLNEKKVKEFLDAHLEEPYSVMNLFDIARYWFFGITNVMDTEDDWICSELACECWFFASNGQVDIVKEQGLPSNDFCAPMDIHITKLATHEYVK